MDKRVKKISSKLDSFSCGVFKPTDNGNWLLMHKFHFWTDAEEWKEKHCKEGIIEFLF